jgi:hypothetical protein
VPKGEKMKKIFGMVLALALVLGFSLVTATPVAADPGTTYYVSTAGNDTSGNGTEGNPWRSIQYAIGQVGANDTITVAAGLYKENIVIDKSLTLKGAQAGVDARTRSGAETIIEPTGEVGIELVSAADRVIVIDGLTVQNVRTGVAAPNPVGKYDINDITVKNVRVANCTKGGITMAYASNATVEYCYVEGTEYGINAGSLQPLNATVATFRHNEIVNAEFGVTGYLKNSLIEGNLIRDFSNGGVAISGQFQSTEIKNNTITGYVKGAGLTFEEHYGRLLSENVKVKGNNVTGNRYGFYVFSTQTTLTGITVNFNNFGGNPRYGVWNEGGETLDASRNWWGDDSGPGGVGPGDGDDISSKVLYSPWLGAALATVKTELVTNNGTVGAMDEADTEVAVNGTATVTVVQYADNPGGNATRCLTTLNKYIDVYAPNTTQVTELEIELYYTNDEFTAANISEESLRLFSWNGTAWVQCSDSGVNTTITNNYSGYVWAKIGGNTTPSLANLQGTPFGGYGLRSLVLFIATTELPDGQQGAAYEATLEACVGAKPYTWAITNGALPDGLALDTKTGIISGTPTRAGVFDFTITVTDAAQITATCELSITINKKPVCFIATAAYGTRTAQEISILREFRDTVLLPNSLGAKSVSLYYGTSAPVANFISQHEVLRTAVRVGFIDPIVAISNWSHDLWSASALQ